MSFYCPLKYDGKARKALCGSGEILTHVAYILNNISGSWDESKIKTALEITALDTRKKIGQIFFPIRAAIFGKLEHPVAGADLVASIAIIGKKDTIIRICLALNLERLRRAKKIDKAIIAAVSILA